MHHQNKKITYFCSDTVASQPIFIAVFKDDFAYTCWLVTGFGWLAQWWERAGVGDMLALSPRASGRGNRKDSEQRNGKSWGKDLGASERAVILFRNPTSMHVYA